MGMLVHLFIYLYFMYRQTCACASQPEMIRQDLVGTVSQLRRHTAHQYKQQSLQGRATGAGAAAQHPRGREPIWGQ